MADDNSYRLVLETSKEALTAAPDFAWTARTGTAMDANGSAMTAPADTAMSPATIDRSTMQNVDRTTLTADQLKGTAVYGTDDTQIGSISDFVLGTDNTTIDAVIVDVGGFLGLGAKPVALAYDNLDFSVDQNGTRYLFVNTTKDALEAQPAFNRDTYAADRDQQRMVIGMAQ